MSGLVLRDLFIRLTGSHGVVEATWAKGHRAFWSRSNKDPELVDHSLRGKSQEARPF